MYKIAIRTAPRRALSSRALNSSRRFLSTAPPAQKRSSWKGSAARWGLAAAGVYYYNTSNVFAEEPEAAIQRLDESIHHVQESSQPTIDAIVAEKRERQAQAAAEERKKEHMAKAALAGEEQEDGVVEGEESLEGLEDEAGHQGAFNPETGEINWDCSCLGGMAHGPCGEEFKAAFSCFVYSNEEPKGVECIEKFKGMQDCFRQHPEMYASELDDDEDELEEELRAREAAQPGEGGQIVEASAKSSTDAAHTTATAPESKTPGEPSYRNSSITSDARAHTSGVDNGELVPKATHDAASK